MIFVADETRVVTIGIWAVGSRFYRRICQRFARDQGAFPKLGQDWRNMQQGVQDHLESIRFVVL